MLGKVRRKNEIANLQRVGKTLLDRKAQNIDGYTLNPQLGTKGGFENLRKIALDDC